MTLPQDHIGVDIAKDWIDIHWLSSRQQARIQTTKKDLLKFAKQTKGALVVLEASGGYERPVTEALAAVGAAYVRVNPRQAREFARVCGKLAKTDRVDAESLARMGRSLELSPTQPTDPARERLSDLVARRNDLTTTIQRERNRAGMCRDRWLAKDISSLLSTLYRHLKSVEAQISNSIKEQKQMVEAATRLQSVPGIGPTISAVLIARLPELGELDAKRIAALAGLAPHACDTGHSRGKRRIWGGRADVRRALYLAAFIASRYDPGIKAFRSRLNAAGKPTKVAITACARKLLTILNAMERDQKMYEKRST